MSCFTSSAVASVGTKESGVGSGMYVIGSVSVVGMSASSLSATVQKYSQNLLATSIALSISIPSSSNVMH